MTALRQSVPQSASGEFVKTQTKRVKFSMTTCASVAEVYSNLAENGKKTRGADCATLGDEWLAPAIVNGLIRPVPNAESSLWYRSLPPVWRALVRRDPRTGGVSSSGLIYGAPYRFGCATLAYRKDKLPKGAATERLGGFIRSSSERFDRDAECAEIVVERGAQGGGIIGERDGRRRRRRTRERRARFVKTSKCSTICSIYKPSRAEIAPWSSGRRRMSFPSRDDRR